MSIQNVRLEVMQFLEKKIDHFMEEFLIPVKKFGNLLIYYLILLKKIS